MEKKLKKCGEAPLFNIKDRGKAHFRPFPCRLRAGAGRPKRAVPAERRSALSAKRQRTLRQVLEYFPQSTLAEAASRKPARGFSLPCFPRSLFTFPLHVSFARSRLTFPWVCNRSPVPFPRVCNPRGLNMRIFNPIKTYSYFVRRQRHKQVRSAKRYFFKRVWRPSYLAAAGYKPAETR